MQIKITRKKALELAGGKLPAVGRERLVTEDGKKHFWLTKHPSGWYLLETDWKLKNGYAVLEGR